MLLCDVINDGAYINLAAKERLSHLYAQDRSFAYAAAALTVENLERIDGILSEHIRAKRVNGKVRNILRLSACQLLYMDVPARSAVDEGVKLARECGKGELSGFVNGVLRSVAAACDREAPQGVPDWLRGILAKTRTEEEIAAFAAYKPSGVSIRLCDEGAKAELEKRGAELTPGRYLPEIYSARGIGDISADPLFNAGRYTVMGEASAIAVRSVYAGQQRALCACAAPGGKAAYMSFLGCRDITAWDIYPHRVSLLRNTLDRLNVENYVAEARDASVYDEKYDSAFPLVVVDAPCSGLGVLHKKADMLLNRSAKDIAALCAIQRGILDTCAKYVGVGGTLAYFTCTVTQEENAGVVDGFLAAHPGFSPRALALPEELKKYEHAGRIELSPERTETDGFFIAAMTRDR